MKSQAAEEPAGNSGASVKSYTDGDGAEVLNMLRQSHTPWLYCYPRARAHSSLAACCRAVETAAATIRPSPPPCVASALRALSRKDTKKVSVPKEIPVDVQLSQRVYPNGQVPLVSDSTAGMIEAILRHLCISQGSTVFLPGLLMYSHFCLLELFEKWGLCVVGYDVDFVTMRVDEGDLRRKALKIGLPSHNNRSSSSGNKDSNGSTTTLILLMGVGGRFLTNTDSVTRLARKEFRALTVELHPITAAAFLAGGVHAASLEMHADVHITCMDAVGELGGAVACAADPLLARGVLERLQEQQPTEARRHWVALARHIVHLLLSDGMSFQLVLRVVQWWSLMTGSLRLGHTHENDVAASADRIFQFLMAPSKEQGISLPCVKSNSSCGGGSFKKTENVNTTSQVFRKPHKGRVMWMLNAISDVQQRMEAECFSLWEFLSRMRNDVEVVSCGEPGTPWRCVLGYSDSVLLRVRSPGLAARALRTAGYDAVAANTRVWDTSNSSDNNTNNNYTTGEKRPQGSAVTLREVVVLPDCPQCEALARHALFLPLYPEMKWKNRKKLYRVMNATFPASLFRSPSTEFQQHVMSRTPSRHAYRSMEVSALISSWQQRGKNKRAFFVDPQPLLLWLLVGPVPGYLLSKL
ncbi:hypothetical protein DQ04_08341010 [Trypanosoma grayi]|uniref:hypothetical protein n=1 Tax=Trypanosoma grayi TaxID=71804 RepID=UPI0004F42186|nr:hypothetical protein DQ04_08341010 [Trypanosoma grayi]KEG07970.1 hypothetical protein DQ04_08341010 [Trypanosoma grayi]